MPNCDKRGFFRKKQVSLQIKTNYSKPEKSLYKPLWLTCGLYFYLQKWPVCVFCLCSVGRLEVSSGASAGVWIGTACQSPQTLNRGAAWVVRMGSAWAGEEEAEASFAHMRKRWRNTTQSLKEPNTVSHLQQPAALYQWEAASKSGVTLSPCALYWTY